MLSRVAPEATQIVVAGTKQVAGMVKDLERSGEFTPKQHIREMVLQQVPQLAPPQLEVYHVTGTGNRIHRRRNCFGLRSISRGKERGRGKDMNGMHMNCPQIRTA